MSANFDDWVLMARPYAGRPGERQIPRAVSFWVPPVLLRTLKKGHCIKVGMADQRTPTHNDTLVRVISIEPELGRVIAERIDEQP